MLYAKPGAEPTWLVHNDGSQVAFLGEGGESGRRLLWRSKTRIVAGLYAGSQHLTAVFI